MNGFSIDEYSFKAGFMACLLILAVVVLGRDLAARQILDMLGFVAYAVWRVWEAALWLIYHAARTLLWRPWCWLWERLDFEYQTACLRWWGARARWANWREGWPGRVREAWDYRRETERWD